jgi:DNA-binding GntR family transcriptional regulator
MSCFKHKKQGEPMLAEGWTPKMKTAALKKTKDSLSKQRNHLRATYVGKFLTLSYLFHIDIAQWCMN